MKHPINSIRFSAMVGLAMMAVAVALPVWAEDLTVTMKKATQSGTSDTLGTVTISETSAGAAFKLELHGLPPGPHGFLVHENADCGPTFINGVRIPAGAAGAPLDPDNTGKHEGPSGNGYLGDLPALTVQLDGTTTQTLIAPRIKNTDILKGHALIVHIYNDNYSDSPNLTGGVGGRLACGLIG
ncbi:superoxide dismutase family protein [Acidisphaera sp. S103]|uniref:superoxide dismutase family protein n=1 Tax=Acidisphaera sp. S103 TaxID=1747223 RepID=UPI001C20A3EF|nr:superoxide dismutase family protein [Acidisphaera sp. S103]